MTNAIEQAKREMYNRLSNLKSGLSEAHLGMNLFELDLEKYLELLRQDHEALHEALASANQTITQCAAKSSEDIRKIEAVNRSLVRELLYVTEARDKLLACTSGQTSGDRASCEATDSQKAAIHGALSDIRTVSDNWALNGVRAKKSMLKISGILARPEVYAAMEAAKPIAGKACEYCDGLGYIHCNGGRPTAPCPNGCQ